VFSPLVADDDDELRVHCRYFFFLSIPTEDNKEAPICRHLLMLCSSIPKNDDELALVVVFSMHLEKTTMNIGSLSSFCFVHALRR
jgi:hypothetical protein